MPAIPGPSLRSVQALADLSPVLVSGAPLQQARLTALLDLTPPTSPLPMLSGAARTHSQRHAKHALRPIHPSPSCALSRLQALAPCTAQPTPLAHAYPLPRPVPVSAVSHAPRPRAPVEHRGQFPASVIHTVDAFSSATKDQLSALIPRINASPKLRRYIRQRESARRLAQFLASTSRPSRAYSLMTLSHALGCRFKPNHFETVVYQLSLGEAWPLIPPLVALAINQCGKTTARLLNWKIRAFIECHRFAQLDHVLQQFASANVQPTRRTFHLLVSGHLRNLDLDSAKRSLHLMENAGFPIDVSTHALIVAAYRSLGLDPQVHARALDALHHADARISTRILNSIIQQLLDVGDEPGATEHINRMIATTTSTGDTLHQPRDTTTGPDGVVSSPTGAFLRLPERISVVHPDVATITILINYLNNHRQFHRIHKILGRMINFGIKPDSGLVAALIRTCCLSGRDDLAASLLAAMLGSDAEAQGVLALLRVKSVPQLPINVRGIGLTVHVFNAILARVMEARGLSGAKLIIRIMRSNGVQPNATTIEVFLNHLVHIERIQTDRLTQVLRSMSRKVHGPTVRHLNIVLRHALRLEKHRAHGSGWDTTAAKFSLTRRQCALTSRANHHALDPKSFDPSGSRHHPRNDSRLRSTMLALSRKGVKSDRATFAMWLRHEAITDPTLGTAKTVFRHMVDQGMHPNRHHYLSLMDGFMRAGDMQAAELVMQSAKAAGFEPDVVMWTVLISGYALKGEPGLAMRTFRTMVATGIPPDVPAIDALAHAYFAVGAYSIARKVLLELWPRVKPFPSQLKNAPLKQLAHTFRQPDKSGVVWKEPSTPSTGRSLNRRLRQVLREWTRE